MTTPIERGAMARTTKETANLFGGNGDTYRKGFVFTVDEFVPVLPEWKDDPEYIQVDFYEGSSSGGYGNVAVAASDVELVKTRAEMEARQGPTLAELTEYLSSHLDGTENFNVNGSDRDTNDGTVEFMGQMRNGLDFVFTVKIIDHGVVDL